jgi:hypothetical protein
MLIAIFRLFFLLSLASKVTSLRGGHNQKGRLEGERKLSQGTWLTIINDDFEAGVGSHFSLPTGGDDATEHDLTADSIGAHSGNTVIRLRDSGAESIMTSTLMDVSQYDQIEVSFYYRGEGLENGDKFIIEFQNDDTGPWRIAKDFIQDSVSGKDMNGQWSNQMLRWILHDGTKPIESIRIRFQNFGDSSDIVVSSAGWTN